MKKNENSRKRIDPPAFFAAAPTINKEAKP